MLEKLLRARLPEQIVALIENLEQNPDASHLEKVSGFLDHYKRDITQFEHWMLMRTMRKVRKLVKRDELLRGAMAIVINAPEERVERVYDPNTYIYKGIGRYDTEVDRMMAESIAKQQASSGITSPLQGVKTWIDPRGLY
jgi:hypothetical protein